MSRKRFPVSTWRDDREDFAAAAIRWTLTRWYALLFGPVVVLALLLYLWGAYEHASQPVQQLTGTVTESSRPLDAGDKAPVDWTQDGRPDGWVRGEWLPGERAPVYFLDGQQVDEPMSWPGYAVTGIFLVGLLLAVCIIAGFLIFDRLFRRAWEATNRDWQEFCNQHPAGDANGVPLWVR